jgi:hypothetical protein
MGIDDGSRSSPISHLEPWFVSPPVEGSSLVMLYYHIILIYGIN